MPGATTPPRSGDRMRPRGAVSTRDSKEDSRRQRRVDLDSAVAEGLSSGRLPIIPPNAGVAIEVAHVALWVAPAITPSQGIDGRTRPDHSHLPGIIPPQKMKDHSMTSPPPDRFLRLKQVLDRTGLSRATLYRKIHAETFPPQDKLSTRCCGWRESHVNIWLRNPMTFTIADLPPKDA